MRGHGFTCRPKAYRFPQTLNPKLWGVQSISNIDIELFGKMLYLEVSWAVIPLIAIVILPITLLITIKEPASKPR